MIVFRKLLAVGAVLVALAPARAEQSASIACPPELQRGYEAALRGISTGNARVMDSALSLIERILRAAKALQCQLER